MSTLTYRFNLHMLLCLVAFFTSHYSTAANHYRSVATGNWSSLSTWQESNDNVIWVAATTYPGQTPLSSVTIQSPNTVSLDVDPSGSGFGIPVMTVNAGATLKDLPASPTYLFSFGSLTVSGTINLTNSVVVAPLRYIGFSNLTVNAGGSVSALRLICFGGIITNNGNVTATGPGGFQSQIQGSATINGSGIFSINSLLITNGSTLTSNFNGTYNETFNTFIDTGSSFIIGASATAIYNLSSITVSSNTSVFNSSAIHKTKQVVIAGDVSNAGTFTAGSATTKTINLSGANTIQFNDTLKVNTGFVTTNSGTVAVNTQMTGAGTFTQAANSTLNYGGASNSITTLNATATGNTVNYNSATTNQAIAAFGYYNLTMSGTGGMTKTLSAATVAAGTVSIQNNSIFSLGGFNLSVGVDWNNSSSATLAGIFNTTVTFNGSVQQNIINTGAAFGTFFYNVTFNNTFATSPQIVFQRDILIQNSLTMLKGNINLNGNQIQLGISTTLTTTLTHSGLASAGWVYNGFFFRIFKDGTTLANGSVNGLFPVGTSSDFRPFYLSFPTVAITNGQVFVKATSATNTTIVNIADTGGPIVRQHQGFWQVSSSATTGTFNINAGGTGFGVVANVNDLRLSLAASVVGSAGTNSGTNSFPMVQRTGLTAANTTNNFYMSSVEPIGSYLPVELVSFSAKANGDMVSLEWQTLSELNSLQFNVLRSTNGKDFHLVGSMDGQGTTNKAHDYLLTDFTPAKGINYYRLEQVGSDGKTSTLKTIAVEVSTITPIKIFPNPVREGEAVTLDLNGLSPNSEKEIQVTDLKGNLVLTVVITTDESGTFRGALNLQEITSGLYIVNLDGVKCRLFIR